VLHDIFFLSDLLSYKLAACLGVDNFFKDKLIGSGDGQSLGEASELRSTLQDLESVFDTLPAGTDEVVALANVVNLVKNGGFDRIVIE
jgi:hypothetical protein